jgi:hypothetical protein
MANPPSSLAAATKPAGERAEGRATVRMACGVGDAPGEEARRRDWTALTTAARDIEVGNRDIGATVPLAGTLASRGMTHSRRRWLKSPIHAAKAKQGKKNKS